jgi:hypothetical protein
VAALNANDDPRVAAETLAAAEAMREAMGIVELPAVAGREAALEARLRVALAQDFDAAWESGRRLDAFVALDRALDVSWAATG